MVHRLHTKCRLTSRTEEECHPTVRGVRAGESVLGAEKTVALGTGLARERRLLITGEPPKQAEDRKKPNPSACTGLAEHLLPRRHGLIQSFLRQNHSLGDMGVLNATSQLGQDLTFVSLNLGILQGKALDGAKKAEATADSRYRLFRNIGYGLYGLVAVIIVVGKHYKYDWHRQMQDTDTNQHYVSQFLLRGFHTENEAQIWAFDKLTDRSFTTAIDRVASEHGFYNIAGSAEIDDVIRKFEDATAPIVEEIRTRKSLRTLNEYKRIWLSGFTALQYVRTRGFSERSQDMMKQITDVVKQIGSGNLSKKLRRQLGLDAPGSEHEKTLSTILGLVRPVADELLEKTCVLYRSDGALPFWIGDSPVTMHNTIN